MCEWWYTQYCKLTSDTYSFPIKQGGYSSCEMKVTRPSHPQSPTTILEDFGTNGGVTKLSKFEYHMSSAYFLSFLQHREFPRGATGRGPSALGERWEKGKGRRCDMFQQEEQTSQQSSKNDTPWPLELYLLSSTLHGHTLHLTYWC